MIEVINKQFFHLYNNKISYLINILENDQIGYIYYGKRLKSLTLEDCEYLTKRCDKSAGTVKYYKDNSQFTLADIFQEYPVYGTTSYQSPSIEIKKGSVPCYLSLSYCNHRIYRGKEMILDVPQSRNSNKATTLELILKDDINEIKVNLYYTIYHDETVVVRKSKIKNVSSDTIFLERAMSGSLNLYDDNYRFVHLSGNWAKERQVKEHSLSQGTVLIESLCGSSSHQQNPFVALVHKDSTLTKGDAYGCNLMYSGNFLAQVDVNEWSMTRLLMGIHPQTFQWQLLSGDEFITPEVILGYSDEGCDGLARNYAKFIESFIIDDKWSKFFRPIVLNSWEAYYFDFTNDQLLQLAKIGKEVGIECFVVDDGWFSNRNNDRSSLGDWFANEKKFKNGLGDFAKKIHSLNLKFGMWFEPEMVNEESCLYLENPDWIVRPPKGRYSYGRGQLVLDFANPEVVEAIYEQIDKVIKETDLDYIKWDMNRNITEAYSPYLARQELPQGEFFHRYILGVYRLYEKITVNHPDVLIEGCAGGGGRFDLGILYYSPQIWVSDDTDAIERLKIQFGTTLAYPISCLSNHISAIPNHQINRNTSLKTRGDVAFFGNLGYELDLTKSTLEELKLIKRQINDYKIWREFLSKGTLYRLTSPYENKFNEVTWALITDDKRDIFVGYYYFLANLDASPYEYIKLSFIDDDISYINLSNNQIISSNVLKNIGLKKPIRYNGVNKDTCEMIGDFQSRIIHLKAVD